MNVQFDKQFPVYAFDTACFYTDAEMELDHQLQTLRVDLAAGLETGMDVDEKSALNKRIQTTKDQLKQMINENMGLVRSVRAEALKPSNMVQVFESNLTRSLGMQPDELNLAMVIVKVYYFGVAESIIKHGFTMNGKEYVFFSASAGQIRTKKFVAIQKDLLDGCMNSLTCGLSVEKINEAGGVNVNKYLAYLALCNSATEVWTEFNINQSIVIDDFETNVTGTVDFIDEHDYSITRKLMDVPITHTDGCGMMLPSISKKAFMVRAPWMKGLLEPFDFVQFIHEANERDPSVDHALITDIYGKEHHILREKIRVIFTKSQFKMWKYYKDWEEYQKNFKAFKCQACRCNIEPSKFSKATINYQMLQTLTGASDDEIAAMAAKTNDVLSRISSDRHTMLRVLGATISNPRKGAFQKSLLLYPEMLRDEHCRNILREMKKSIENDARAGKLMVDGIYQFLSPDLYAACQHWFEHIDQPDGLLSGDEVWSAQYPQAEKLDVLRSPHLYREHQVLPNVFATKPECERWYNPNSIYTSSHSLVSKVLQFDKQHCQTCMKVQDIKLREPAHAGCLPVMAS